MKTLLKTAFLVFISFLLHDSAFAQTEMQQRIERYLYANYNSNKTALRENEHVIKVLEEKFDKFVDNLSKEEQAVVKNQEKQVNQYLLQIEKIEDVVLLKQFVEKENVKKQPTLEKFLSKNLNTAVDALECRKLIVIKLAEFEIVKQRQEKLLALLKDDVTRTAFIQGMIQKGKVKEESDLKAFTATVDVEVDQFKL